MNITTNDDLMKEFLTPDEIKEINDEAQKLKKKLHGGKRAGAGRKPKTDNVLEFRIRVSRKEKDFIDYAREHKLNYDDLMQG